MGCPARGGVQDGPGRAEPEEVPSVGGGRGRAASGGREGTRGRARGFDGWPPRWRPRSARGGAALVTPGRRRRATESRPVGSRFGGAVLRSAGVCVGVGVGV